MMRTALIAILLAAGPAWASAEDDYVACLIGQSAVALHKGNDSAKAQEIAYDLCPEPKIVAENEEADGLYDFVNLMVERMAAE